MDEDGVHGFVVIGEEFLHDVFEGEEFGEFFFDGFDNLVDNFFSIFARRTGGSGLDGENGFEQGEGLVLSSGDFSVFVHSKGFWRGTEWQGLNVLNVVREFSEVGCIVESTFTELVIGLEHVWRDVLLQDSLDQAHVFVVSHSPTVVDF